MSQSSNPENLPMEAVSAAAEGAPAAATYSVVTGQAGSALAPAGRHVHGPDCGCGAEVLEGSGGHGHGEHEHVPGITCACGHDHADESHSHAGVALNLQLTVILPLTIAALVLACGVYFTQGPNAVSKLLGLLAAALAGGPIIWQAIKGLSRGSTNVNELVSLSIVGAVWLDMPIEAGLVALILQVGALIESVATESARNAVLALQKLAPRHARVRHGDHEHVVDVSALKPGDILVVQPGERIAADGKILSGVSSVDESSVTGESVPVDKHPGSEALAGTINLSGSVEVGVERVGEHSALGQTIALVRRAHQFQPEIIRAADKFFAFYTPIVLFASFIVLAVTLDPERMVTMWVVGCPCAMLLASPLAIVVSLARASRSGIQVKAGPFFEASASLTTVVFDKTGTLTTGQFVVRSVRPAAGVSAGELLMAAAAIEQRSSHPLARAIVAHAQRAGLAPPVAADAHVTILEGLGVETNLRGEVARAGSLKIVPAELATEARQLEAADESLPVVPVYVLIGGKLLGAVYLTDEIRPEASKTIRRLRDLGIKRIGMLTGDRRRTAELVARAVGCDDVYAELLPGQKVELIRQLQRGGRGVAMIGDGVNDSPALAMATIGIAMGVRGTDVAIQAADAVLLKDDLTRVPLLIYLAKQTRSAIYQNLLFAVIFAGAAEAAAAAGIFGPVVAALVHIAGVVVIAMNSVRLAGSPHRRPVPRRAAAAVGAGLAPALVPA